MQPPIINPMVMCLLHTLGFFQWPIFRPDLALASIPDNLRHKFGMKPKILPPTRDGQNVIEKPDVKPGSVWHNEVTHGSFKLTDGVNW